MDFYPFLGKEPEAKSGFESIDRGKGKNIICGYDCPLNTNGMCHFRDTQRVDNSDCAYIAVRDENGDTWYMPRNIKNLPEFPPLLF